MVFLALALMVLIVITQLFTNKSTQALTYGNKQAVETFKLNNRNQIIVNLSFDLQSKLSNPNLYMDEARRGRLTDSLTVMGYNTTILASAIKKSGHIDLANEINELINSQLNLCLYILVTFQTENPAKRAVLTDSLRKAQFGDKVYAKCLQVQKELENNLQNTLVTNSEQAGKLSAYSRILALVAIIAIVIMANIIIRRQSQQLKLIHELKAAESAALKSKNAKDQFLANMSHELRTPLNALVGFGNLLKGTPLNFQQKEYVNIISSSSYNLLNIVNDVLDLSKIEAGKLRIKSQPFNLQELFKNIELMFSESIADKGLLYEWHIDDKVPEMLKGDSSRLEQILVNLIGNAIKFTSNGVIRLYAGLVWTDTKQNAYKLGFTVKDTGIGIPKDKIQAVFERFEQLEHITTREHGGTGLGLTIVKSLVENLGGTISVYSEVGVGSEFNFTCVFGKVDGNEKVEEISKKTKTLYSFDGIRILAVEDNKANQVLIKHMLQKYDLNLSISPNGINAIDLLKKEKFDLILMDIQMPVMDGYTAIDKLRNELKLITPIIAMTAYVSEAEMQKCLASGFNDYLAKPIEEHALVNLISKYVAAQTVLISENGKRNDLDYLKDLLGGDGAAIDEILNEMHHQWERDRADLTSAVSAKDIREVKRILHRMKSTFSPLGPDHIIYALISAASKRINDNREYKIIPEEFERLTANITSCLQTIEQEHVYDEY